MKESLQILQKIAHFYFDVRNLAAIFVIFLPPRLFYFEAMAAAET